MADGIGTKELIGILGGSVTAAALGARWIILKWFEREDRRDAKEDALQQARLDQLARENAALHEVKQAQAATIEQQREKVHELYRQITQLQLALARAGVERPEGTGAENG